MALSAFDDRSRQPQEADLHATLKGSFVFWNELHKLIESRFGPVVFEWGFTSKTTGWDSASSRRSEPFST